MDLVPNRVSQSLDGREVLLTGATGYVGKVLLEKLLRSCPGIRTVFVLLRAKKGKDATQRLQELLDTALFEKVRRMSGGALLHKVVVVEGDVSAPDLGLDESSRELLCSSVSVVFHGAATIRFDEPLKSAVLLNARGTLLLLKLATNMTKLKSFVHISTAYCHPENRMLLEKLYEPPYEPHDVIRFMENSPDDVIDAMTPKLLNDYPNTYVFTKALAEALCEEFFDELPIAIVRPSIVFPIWKEPLVGWVDNLNGPVGIFVGSGKGVIHSLLTDKNVAPDLIPVDIVVNGIILASWDCMDNVLQKNRERVYNITSYKAYRMTWRDFKELGVNIVETVSFENTLWCLNLEFTKCKFVHFYRVLFYQLLPAFFLDIVIRLAGYEPILLRVQRKILKTTSVLQIFIQTEWELDNREFHSLAGKLNSREKSAFYCTLKDLDWNEYYENGARGAKCYVLNESLEKLPAARRHYRRMYWLDRICRGAFYSLLLWMGHLYIPQILQSLQCS